MSFYPSIFSSPEPKAHWWAFRIGRPLSSVRPLSTLFKHLLLRKHWLIEAKFHMESPWIEGTKVFFKQSWSHDPRWPPCPYMLKTLKNLLLRNQKADDLETWHAASGARVLPGLFKWWPLCFVWKEGKTMDFSETIVVYDLKLATDDRSDKKFLLTTKLLGLSAPAPRLYTCINLWKKLTNEWSDKTFLSTSKLFSPVCPCPGAIYMYKIMKKIYFRHFFKPATDD